MDNAILLLEQLHQFAGDYPEVPFAPGVDKDGFGDDPLFITLPVGKVNARSRNGRTYSEQAVKKMVEQINKKRPEGGFGHIPNDQRGTFYKLPDVRWLGALMDASGTVWGKAIAISEEARRHFRNAKAAGAMVGTSVYGNARLDGENVVDLDLERIDIADPARVGIPETAAQAVITSEMEADETMPEDNNNQQVVGHLQEQVTNLTTELNEARGAVRIISELQEVLGTDGNLVTQIQEMQTELARLRREALAGEVNAVIAEMVQVEKLQPIVAEMLTGVSSVDDARQKIETIMAKPHMQELAKSIVGEMAGPPAVVTAAADAAKKNIGFTAEQIAAARERTGI